MWWNGFLEGYLCGGAVVLVTMPLVLLTYDNWATRE